MQKQSVRDQLQICAAVLLAAASIRYAESRSAAAEPIDFTRHIRPIFTINCVKCHGPSRQENGLRLDVRAAALRGGDSGPAVVPGRSSESELIRRITAADAAEHMPPQSAGNPLTRKQIELLRAWIDQGAPWPDDGRQAEVVSDHWAYQPLGNRQPPAVSDPNWPRTPIDNFILARLEAAGISPSPEADRYTLIKRLYYDLIGLPPTPAEVDAFISDSSPDAYERLLDRLLASPHFGERWGRHWLDKARYADSDGYEKDNPRPDAWRYRQWVIDAINADLPFDRFTIEQLAGDLLPGATDAQRLATALHRQTLTNTEGGVDQEEFRVAAVVDRVNTTATVWLGLTVACAQCHSHKYDQITQNEYYQLFAFFNNADEVTTEISLGRVAEAEYVEKLASHKTRLQELQSQLARIATDDPEREQLQKQLEDLTKKAPARPVMNVRTLAERTDNPRTTHLLRRGDFLQPGAEVEPGTLVVLHPFRPREGTAPNRLDLARWFIAPENPLTPRVTVNHVWAHLFGRGLVRTVDDFGVRGEPPTHPDLLDWLAREYMSGPGSRRAEGGRQKAKGSRQAATDNGPRTTDNSQPSTLNLQLSWSRKALIRTIVLSAAYRQSSHHRPELLDIDSLNDLFHRQNRFRVEAEIVRDLHLAAGGLLSRKIGGPSVFPPMPPDVAALSYANNFKWNTSEGADRYRRGMYTFFKRTAPHPNLMTFDCPDSNVTTVERRTSNTPLMALTTLNNEVFTEAAQALAARVLSSAAATDADRLTLAFRLCVARPPAESDLKGFQQLLDDSRAWYQQHPADAQKLAGSNSPPNVPTAEVAAWVATARIIMNLDEFITRE